MVFHYISMKNLLRILFSICSVVFVIINNKRGESMKLKRFLIVLISIMILTGCGNTSRLNPKDPVTVTLWHYYLGENLTVLEESISLFNRTVGMENGVIVSHVAMGSIRELEENITNSVKGVINSQPLPDIFSSYPDKALEIDGYGKLVDLNKYFNEDEKDEYISSFLEDGYFNEDRLLLLPVLKSTEVLYVNNTAWSEFATTMGISNERLSTWEDIYDIAREYYQWIDGMTPNIMWDGLGMIGFDSIANYIVAGNRQMGIEIIYTDEDGNGKIIIDKEVMRNIFSIYYNGYSMGYFDAVGRFRSDDIKTNDLIAYVGATSGAAYFPTWVEDKGEKIAVDLLALDYPVFKGGRQYSIQQGAGMCMVKTDERHQEGAALFLKWFTEEDNNVNLALTTGYIPVKESAYTSQGLLATIDAMLLEDGIQKNIGSVYNIAIHQIVEGQAYAVRPFLGSYDARKVLQDSLIEIAKSSRELAIGLQQENKTEQEILEAIQTNLSFEKWINILVDTFTDLNIQYEIID